MMTPKQRVRAALARQKPDRVPTNVSFNAATKSSLYEFQGLSARDKIMRDLGVETFDAVLERLRIDIRMFGPRGRDFTDQELARRKRFVQDFRAAETPADLKALEWPHWDEQIDLSHVRDDFQQLLDSGDWGIRLSGPAPWEVARDWRGFDQAMMDWASEPEILAVAYRKAYEMYMPRYEVMAEKLGELADQVDAIYAGGDLAMQTGPMMDPSLVEQHLEPMIKQEIDALHAMFPNAAYEFHCCGAASAFYPMFERCGVDAVHPVQPGCPGMDLAELKSRWGGVFAFCGAVDAQGVMARGSAEDVRNWARYAFQTLGADGGFMFAPHGITPEVPTENILALFDTAYEECRY